MSAENDSIIEIDVVLKARVDDGDVQNKIQEGGEDKLADDLLDSEINQARKDKAKAMQEFENFASSLDSQGLKNLKSLVTNPGATVENKLLGLLGRAGIHGAVAVANITLVIQSPEVIKAVIETLGQKGGPLNQDYTRKIDEEIQVGIDKDLQFRRAAGLDVIITTEDTKYIISDPGFVNNSLVDIERTRSIRINSNETQYGYANGL